MMKGKFEDRLHEITNSKKDIHDRYKDMWQLADDLMDERDGFIDDHDQLVTALLKIKREAHKAVFLFREESEDD